MKKAWAVIMAGIIGFGLAGCGSTSATASSATASENASKAASATTASSETTKSSESTSSGAAASSTASTASSVTASTASAKTSSAASGATASGAAAETSSMNADVTIFIAASLEKVFTEKIIPLYNETRPNVKITVNSGSSGDLAKQITEGAACDLFFSAGKKQVTTVTDAGFTIDGSEVDLLENEVVLIKRAGAETKVTGFDNITDASSLALCADSVPAGQYARTIFETMGITDKVMAMTINECDKVTAALSAVSEGSNEVGIVYASDAANESGVEVIAKATKDQLPQNPLYPVVLIKNTAATGDETAAAADFEKFLQGSDAMKIFSDYTFIAHSAS